MNVVNCSTRLSPAPTAKDNGGVVSYPVILKPSDGTYHRGIPEGVTWNGMTWRVPPPNEGTVVAWVDPITPVAVELPAPAPVEPAVEEQPTAFNVVLTAFNPAAKMAAIKVIRELTGLTLGDSKALVEGLVKPFLLKEAVPTADAQAMVVKLTAAGVTATLEAA